MLLYQIPIQIISNALKAADPFSKFIIDSKDKITAAKGELESQLDFVQSQIAKIPSEGARLQPIKDLAAKVWLQLFREN